MQGVVIAASKNIKQGNTWVLFHLVGEKYSFITITSFLSFEKAWLIDGIGFSSNKFKIKKSRTRCFSFQCTVFINDLRPLTMINRHLLYDLSNQRVKEVIKISLSQTIHFVFKAHSFSHHDVLHHVHVHSISIEDPTDQIHI